VNTPAKAEAVAAQTKLLAIQNNELKKFNADALKADQTLLNAKEEYSKKTGKLLENEALKTDAVADALTGVATAGEKIGTIAFFESQIKDLQKLQKEVPTTNAAWKVYESQIDAIKKKIDALQNTGVKLPKPQVSDEVDFVAPTLNLAFYEEQLARYQKLQSEFSTNNEEGRAKFQAYAEAISNTELIIQDIQGAEFIPDATKNVIELTEAQKKLLETSELVSQSVSDAFMGLTDNLISSFGLAKNGFQGFIGGLLQTVTKLIAMMLASSISQSIAGATASGSATGPAAIFTTPAFIATAVGGVLAAFASIPKFANGGIVGGTSYYGDKIMARVNSAEMISNTDQQKRIWGAMNNGGGGDVYLSGGFDVSGDKLLLVINRANARKNRIG